MEIRHQIELFMTVAFVLYLISFFVARKRWTLHVVAACVGFAFDMYATYLMVLISGGSIAVFFSLPAKLQLHTFLAIAAILVFFLQAGLGLAAYRSTDAATRILYRRRHIVSAKWIFLPVWSLAYVSGFFLFL